MARGSKNKKKSGTGSKDSPVSRLTDDVLVDIISRVPYKSACCCKCVSRRWRDLISHPDHRKKLPQTLAGFFYQGFNIHRFPMMSRYFVNVSGEGYPLVDPTLSFLPEYKSLYIMDCCNGLLLCCCWKPTDPETFDYVVCNPATEKWVVVVPANNWTSDSAFACLGFDPAVSPHFHVFAFIDEEVAWGVNEDELSDRDIRIEAVAIYSSEAGVWTHRSVKCAAFAIPTNSRAVFFNGTMHLAAYDDLVVAVDTEGNNWRLIGTPKPPYYDVFAPVSDVFLSRSQLYFANSTAGSDGSELSVWVLEDYNSNKWTLKHSVSALELFGTKLSACDYKVISFHPDRNMIFIVCGHKNTLMSYEMDRRKARTIHELGSDCQPDLYENDKIPYFPYVPLFTESLA